MSVSEKKASKESVIVGKKCEIKGIKNIDLYSVLIFFYYCKLKFIWIMIYARERKMNKTLFTDSVMLVLL